MAKSLVGLDLMWKFGWKPFIEDVQRVHNCIKNLENRINRLQTEEFACVGKHKEEKSDMPLFLPNSTFSSNPEFKYSLAVNRDTRQTTYAGVMRKLSPYAIQNLDSTKLWLLAEQLGLARFDASKVWAAVPFSFVADWVLPIQTFLEQFAGNMVPSEYVINGAKWITRKTEVSTKVTFMLFPTPSSNYEVKEVGNRVLTWKGEYSSYVRSTTESWTTPSLYIPSLQLPNLQQSWTGLELLLTRFQTIAR
jgi:hypothetical protein